MIYRNDQMIFVEKTKGISLAMFGVIGIVIAKGFSSIKRGPQSSKT
jgi:hypothetical protein